MLISTLSEQRLESGCLLFSNILHPAAIKTLALKRLESGCLLFSHILHPAAIKILTLYKETSRYNNFKMPVFAKFGRKARNLFAKNFAIPFTTEKANVR